MLVLKEAWMTFEVGQPFDPFVCYPFIAMQNWTAQMSHSWVVIMLSDNITIGFTDIPGHQAFWFSKHIKNEIVEQNTLYSKSTANW